MPPLLMTGGDGEVLVTTRDLFNTQFLMMNPTPYQIGIVPGMHMEKSFTLTHRVKAQFKWNIFI